MRLGKQRERKEKAWWVNSRHFVWGSQNGKMGTLYQVSVSLLSGFIVSCSCHFPSSYFYFVVSYFYCEYLRNEQAGVLAFVLFFPSRPQQNKKGVWKCWSGLSSHLWFCEATALLCFVFVFFPRFLLYCRVCRLEEPGLTESSGEKKTRLHTRTDRNWGEICGRLADCTGGNGHKSCWMWSVLWRSILWDWDWSGSQKVLINITLGVHVCV